MSLFTEAGRKFERAKRAFVDGEGTTYVCRSCETRMDEERDDCPDCGSERVEPE